MRIAILELDPEQRSATGVRGRAMAAFLRSEGHVVDVLAPPSGAVKRFQAARFGLRVRLTRRLSKRRTLPHLWDHLADILEPRVRQGYEVVIARGQDVGYVLTRLSGPLKIIDVANVRFLESYHVWGPNLDEVEETYEKEMAALGAADVVLSPHELLGQYLVEGVRGGAELSDRLLTVPLGCDPPTRHARFAEPPRIVYAGSYHYIQDPYLLASLAKTSPFPLHCYGPADPNRRFLPASLDYRGYAPSVGFLADYQFGLITLSRDRLREFSPATKLPYYLAHGLPVLFPAWMREGHAYPDCTVPYDESTFAARLREAAQPHRWRVLSRAARKRAETLTWTAALRPLGELLRGCRVGGS